MSRCEPPSITSVLRRRKLAWLAAAASLAAASASFAAETVSYPFQGVTLIHRTETSPRNLDIWVAIVDTLAPGVRFQTTQESPYAPDTVIAQTSRSFMTEIGAQLAINGDFYASAGTFNGLVHRDPSNFAAALGNIYSTFNPSRPAFHIGKNNVAHTVTGSGASPNPAVPVWNAVGGSDVLLQDGAIPATWRDPAFATALHPRTAIGVNADRSKVALFAVDGRQAHSGGMNLPEIADMLRNDYDMHWAINLDGGGSTTMAIDEHDNNGVSPPRVLNRPSDGAERPVANSLALFARPTPQPIPHAAQVSAYRQQADGYSHVGAQILSDAPSSSSGAGAALRVGYDTSVGKSRGVLAFDLSGIPANATIHNVSLSLDAFSVNGVATHRYIDLEIYELDDPIVEDQVTWNRSASGNNWTTPGGDFAAPALSSLVAQKTTGLKTFVSTVDFVEAAQQALLGGEPLSLLVTALDAEAWGTANASNLNMRFRSDDATIGQRPTLTVHYSIPPMQGDFNRDGSVDAADYVAWRKGIHAAPLEDDYQIWRSAFAEPNPPDVSSPAVPEPPTVFTLLAGVLAAYFRFASRV